MKTERPPFFERDTILPIIGLTFAWYAMMFIPEITRGVLFDGMDGVDNYTVAFSSTFVINSTLFLIVTASLIACYFYLAPGIKNKLLAFLFCLPWAPIGSAIYIFIVGLLPLLADVGTTSNPTEQVRGLLGIMVMVPIFMIIFAWFPILVLKPTTYFLCMKANQKRREKWLQETSFQTTTEPNGIPQTSRMGSPS